ncbi:hypothetical protein IE81DRAFT_175405 [Ceraceosorus guamensis]|uniref:Peptidase S28 n=1 Tax=Ceraceosorus guamensis TaxID=1522189 RepID=A0A316VUX1_9BASI|nr:hypothetical protein IE81DRAFT_175405 [Ceraceosorus guamensis]PWN41397.1 hypothetical protein IE81DRAFT_175405 [Ceraceosorus guamensis]
MSGFEIFMDKQERLEQTVATKQVVLATQQQIGGESALQVASASIASNNTDYPGVRAGFLTQPLDHFDGTTNVTFQQRFWYHLNYYKPPAERNGSVVPLFITDPGEQDAEPLVKSLYSGWIDRLARENAGIPIVLEHRYYGKSFPNRTELGAGEFWQPDAMRWLTNKQALADAAQFVQKVRFDNVTEETLHSPVSPVIYYGGSYSGARSAHLRLLYPDLIYGSIASSGVVLAHENYPEYFFPISRGLQDNCNQALQASIGFIDSIIAPEPEKGQVQPTRDQNATTAVQALFGLEGLSNPADFANVLSIPLGDFQSQRWDYANTKTKAVYALCDAITNTTNSGPKPANPARREEEPTAVIQGKKVPETVVRFGKYIKEAYVKPCVAGDEGSTVESCFGSSDWSYYTNATDPNPVSWPFQFCTTWGYLQTAAPQNATNDPYATNFTNPRLVSSLLDIEYIGEICRSAFKDGQHYSIPAHPNVTEVNSLGALNITMDRLAYINGQYDPWRPMTTASEEFGDGGASREDTTLRPFKIIPTCYHVCDSSSGTPGNKTSDPAPRVKKVQDEVGAAVTSWLADFVAPPANTTIETGNRFHAVAVLGH